VDKYVPVPARDIDKPFDVDGAKKLGGVCGGGDDFEPSVGEQPSEALANQDRVVADDDAGWPEVLAARTGDQVRRGRLVEPVRSVEVFELSLPDVPDWGTHPIVH